MFGLKQFQGYLVGLIPLQANTTIGELVKALNTIGVSSRDMIAILQSMRVAGALHAELEII